MWILFSLVATISQISRNLISKKSIEIYSPKAITLSRFLFSLPVVFAAYIILGSSLGYVNILSNEFFLWSSLMAVSQILATYFRISLFKYKSFAVSLTIIQIDTILVALIGVIFLKEMLNIYVWIGLIITTSGLILSSLSKNSTSLKSIKKMLLTKATFIALLTGLFLALAAIFVKKTFNYIDGPTPVVESLFTLSIILTIEILFLLPVILKDRDELIKLFKRPVKPIFIGLFSGIGSFCWLTAYSLTKIAYVRAIGQLEFIIATFLSIYYLKERLYRLEILGIALVSLGTLIVITLKV